MIVPSDLPRLLSLVAVRPGSGRQAGWISRSPRWTQPFARPPSPELTNQCNLEGDAGLFAAQHCRSINVCSGYCVLHRLAARGDPRSAQAPAQSATPTDLPACASPERRTATPGREIAGALRSTILAKRLASLTPHESRITNTLAEKTLSTMIDTAQDAIRTGRLRCT